MTTNAQNAPTVDDTSKPSQVDQQELATAAPSDGSGGNKDSQQETIAHISPQPPELIPQRLPLKRKQSVFSFNGFPDIQLLDQQQLRARNSSLPEQLATGGGHQRATIGNATSSISQQQAQSSPNAQLPSTHQQQVDKARRSMRSDTLGSTGSSRASSCDEPTIVAGRSPQGSSSSGFSSASSIACLGAINSVKGQLPTTSCDDRGRKISVASSSGGRLEAGSSSCSLDSISWNSAVDSAGRTQISKSSLSQSLDDGAASDDDEMDTSQQVAPPPSLDAAAAAAARKPPIVPPFESMKAKLKRTNSIKPDRQAVLSHIDNIIIQNEVLMDNWNHVSIRSYNSIAPTTLRDPPSGACSSRRPASGGSESINSERQSSLTSQRPRKRWSTTVLEDYKKLPSHYHQPAVDPIATYSDTTSNSISGHPTVGHSSRSYSAAGSDDNGHHNQLLATNFRLKQFENSRRSSQNHFRKTSEHSLLLAPPYQPPQAAQHSAQSQPLSTTSSLSTSAAAAISSPEPQHQQLQQHISQAHDLSNFLGSSLLSNQQINRQQIQDSPLQLENAIQNLSLKKSGEDLLLSDQQIQQQQQQIPLLQQCLLLNAVDEAHITTTATAALAAAPTTHYNLDQTYQNLRLNQLQLQHQHHHCDEQLAMAILIERCSQTLKSQAALWQLQHQHQHHHLQQQMIERQQLEQQFRMSQLATAAAVGGGSGTLDFVGNITTPNVFIDQQTALMGTAGSVPSLQASLHQQLPVPKPDTASISSVITCQKLRTIDQQQQPSLRNQDHGNGCLPFKKRKISEPIMRYG